MLVVVDDEDRENEGDLTIAAEAITPEIINFMVTHGRGLVCLAMTPERCEQLHLPLMTAQNTSQFGTAFCESIDAKEGVTTGISAADRARTILRTIHPDCRPGDLARPGHVFPLRASEGGVLVRAGQTEAAVDLARLAQMTPAGVICEIMNEDGEMARVPQLEKFCARHGLKMLSVAELIRYRMSHEKFLRRVAEGTVETEHGPFRAYAFSSDLNPEYHVALVCGEPWKDESALVRMQSRCLHGEAFGATTCDCGSTLKRSLAVIAEAGSGALVYLHENGPGFRIEESPCGLGKLVPHGKYSSMPQSDAAQRNLQHEHGIGAQILADLGLRHIRLLTNRPRRIVALEGFGIRVVEQVPLG